MRQLERLTGGGVEPGGGVGVDDCGDELLEVVVVEAVRRGAGGGVVLGVVDGGGKAGEAVEVAEEAVEDGGDGAPVTSRGGRRETPWPLRCASA